MNRTSNVSGSNPRTLLASLAFLGLLWGGGETVLAHGVRVFAYVDGDTVHVEGGFSGGRPVRGGTVRVLDADGDLVASGKTDAGGNFAFPAPAPRRLTIVLDAGPGHRAEWTVRPADFALPGPSATAESDAGTPAEVPSAAATGPEDRPRRPPAALPPEWEGALETLLDRKLAPILRLLAESHRKGPTVTDVLGGLGYIFGLVGAVAWIRSRKTPPDRDR